MRDVMTNIVVGWMKVDGTPFSRREFVIPSSVEHRNKGREVKKMRECLTSYNTLVEKVCCYLGRKKQWGLKTLSPMP